MVADQTAHGNEQRPTRGERELIALKAHAGDSDARNELYTIYRPLISKYALPARSALRRYGGGPIEPDDVEQQAFIVFDRLLQRWDPSRSTFGGYLAQTMPWHLLHFVRDSLHCRGRHRVVSVPSLALDEARNLDLDARTWSRDDEGLNEAESREVWEACARAVDQTWRKPLELRFACGYSSREIAKLSGRSRRAVDRDLRSARDAIVAGILDEWESCV